MAKPQPQSFKKTDPSTGLSFYYGFKTHEKFIDWAARRRSAQKPYTFSEFYNLLPPAARIAIGIEFADTIINETLKNTSITDKTFNNEIRQHTIET
jgi:hypothetical protein